MKVHDNLPQSPKLKPGDVLIFEGRFFRVRDVRERLKPTDYHVTKDQTCFGAWSTVAESGKDAWNKNRFFHLCEIDALQFAMLAALAEETGKEQAS